MCAALLAFLLSSCQPVCGAVFPVSSAPGTPSSGAYQLLCSTGYLPSALLLQGYAQVIDQVLLPVAVNATAPPPGAATAAPPAGSAASG